MDVWSDGRVTLMGDAADAMLQYAAQGACPALEDAVVLGEALAGATGTDEGAGATDDIPRCLERYNVERCDRTARIQLLARDMGERLYHPSGAQALARNVLLRSLSEDDLYHHQVTWPHGARDFALSSAG